MSSVYHHLIDDQCQLIPGFTKEFIQKCHLRNSHTNYNIVSIIGSQNSGKSTLLNRVFGTNFEMLQGSSKTQTTKGIWASHDQDNNILILDVEGSNSRQRGKGEKGSEFYERSTALFALAFSQILIINCNSVNLGHESEYSIIKIIMEMNVRLFRSDQVKQILIVIRDFNDEADDFNEICASVKQEIYGIWNEVVKPAEFQHMAPESIFKIEFFKSAHFSYKRKDFENDMLELRDRFVNPSNPHNLFSGYNYNTNIPIEALEDFATNLWSTIQKNEDLNLPNQKLQASQVRCLKIKEQSLELVEGFIREISSEKSDEYYVSNFNAQAREIVEKALMHYDEESKYYVEQIKLEMRAALNEELKAILFPIFRQKVSQFQDQVKVEVKKITDDLSLKQIDFSHFCVELKEITNEQKGFINSNLHQLLPYQEYRNEWQVSKLTDQITNTVQEMIDNVKNIQLIKFLSMVERQIKSDLETLVSNSLDSLNQNFWGSIKEGYNEIQKRYDETVRNQISGAFTSSFRIQQEIDALSIVGFQFLQEELRKKMRELPYYLLKEFKKSFLKDENNLTRKWKTIPEEDIKQLFLATRKNIEEIVLQFTQFRIIPPEACQQQEQTTVSFHSAIRRSSTVGPSSQGGYDLSVDNPILLEQSAINKIKTQFRDEAEEEYNNVIQQRNTSVTASIPKWMWFVLVFFMYDDVLRWMANPILLYPILLFLSFVGMCVATGHAAIPKSLLTQILSQGAQAIGPLLAKLTQ